MKWLAAFLWGLAATAHAQEIVNRMLKKPFRKEVG